MFANRHSKSKHMKNVRCKPVVQSNADESNGSDQAPLAAGADITYVLTKEQVEGLASGKVAPKFILSPS